MTCEEFKAALKSPPDTVTRACRASVIVHYQTCPECGKVFDDFPDDPNCPYQQMGEAIFREDVKDPEFLDSVISDTLKKRGL